MSERESRLQRLLRSAAQVPEHSPAEMPFGFDTRVVALWRAGNGTLRANGIARLVHRVALVAAGVIIISSAASVREFRATRDTVEPGSNEFAIADSAIQNEFDQ
jgi:hypothetical protein